MHVANFRTFSKLFLTSAGMGIKQEHGIWSETQGKLHTWDKGLRILAR